MNRNWNEIAADLDERKIAMVSRFPAIGCIAQLAAHIANGPLNRALYGWTSMHDLCIQQVDQPPYSGPFLRVSPMNDGMVEFRYQDTSIESRQWHRTVPAVDIIPRFEKFLDQLHWVAR